MGSQDVIPNSDEERLRAFTKAVLADLHALEVMIERGMLDGDERLIGAEQEMVLVDRGMNPAPVAPQVLERLDPRVFTHELAQFNMEANLPPLSLGSDCLRRLERNVRRTVERARAAAAPLGATVMLAGILPTLRLSDLGLDRMMPQPRYEALNRELMRLRGGTYHVHIRGEDECEGTHDSVMLEACNTSFQIHHQVAPSDFALLYNVAQLISAPLLAAAVNSPLLLGHRLWRETRVALFERTVDSRSSAQQARGQLPRVSLGDCWVQESALEVFRDGIARFPVILAAEVEEDPMARVEAGEVPRLEALSLFNSTVWRWNRVCYGVLNGKPHLRIENRILPAGPTVRDEVANAALFHGLMVALPAECPDLATRLEFDAASANFRDAACEGLGATLNWFDDEQIPVSDLLLGQLIPAARRGLENAGVVPEDADRYLGTVEERVRTGQTGAAWMLSARAALADHAPGESLDRALTSAVLRRQRRGSPVHQWPPVDAAEAGDWRDHYRTVREIMTTDLFTVRPEDAIDRALSVMEWERVRHVPVEDADGRPVGLLTGATLVKTMRTASEGTSPDPLAVESVMERDLTLISPDTATPEAMDWLLETEAGCLLVVEAGRLVGIVTAWDFVNAAAHVLRQDLFDAGEESR